MKIVSIEKIPSKIDHVIYVDTDSVDGSSILRTESIGDISIENLFDKLKNNDNHVIDISNREFIFPLDLNLPYYNEDKKDIKYGKVKYIEKHKVKKRKFKIKSLNGDKIIVTEDHSLMVMFNDRLIEKSPLELIKGNKIILYKNNKSLIDEIKEIDDLGISDGYVYDIGMEDSPNTFFANDILVHNSIFLSSLPLIKDYKNLSQDELLDKTLRIASKVQSEINKAYDLYAKKYHLLDRHRLLVKQENVALSGFWPGAKKRYAQWFLYEEGTKVDKIDVKGIDVIRSDFPLEFQKIMKQVLVDILHFKSREDISKLIMDFKTKLSSFPVEDIMFSIGINNIKQYDINREIFRSNKGTPVHYKAALNYNDFLNYHKLIKIPKISAGNKVKWTYLKKNPFNINEFAISGNDDAQEVLDFTKKYIDLDKILASRLENKLQNFYDALNWGQVILNKNINKFFNF